MCILMHMFECALHVCLCVQLRVLKLAQVWPAMNHLLRVVGNALLGLGQLSIILSIIVYAFAVVGMYFFGGKYAHFQHAGQLRSVVLQDFEAGSCVLDNTLLC